MKTMTLILISVSAAFAFASPEEKLTCYSQDGSKLEWNNGYGELSVVDKDGNTLYDVDALTLGETMVYQTNPPKVVTQIIYGDEETDTEFASITEFGGKITVRLDDVIYSCN